MTEKNIFTYKLFLSLNILDFNLFLFENCNPRLKKPPPLSQQPSCKSWIPVKYLILENLVGRWTHLPPPPPPPPIWKRVRLSLRGKYIIRNQILVSKLWYIGQIYTTPKYQKGNWKKNVQFPLEQEKIEPLRQWAQLSIWRDRLGIVLV